MVDIREIEGFDETLDLILERTFDVPVEFVWKAWTDPEQLKQWWAPKPIVTTRVEMDLRPGGRMSSLMVAPDGTEYPTDGCFIEVIPQQRIVMTDTLLAGFRPSPDPFFTAIMTFEAVGDKTKYTAIARHGTTENQKKHEEMGFHDGWGTTAKQLEEVAKELAR
jgi:uncharacterized protein YndB with AHSA1/START domain